jgi:predicted nucleotidyltransferase component of viral defense system
MTIIMNMFSEFFRERAVLCGGMVLRLLDSPRFTNDLDYTFVPFSSKKEIVQPVLEVLKRIPGITLHHTLNSQCLRVLVYRDEIMVQVEIKVALSCVAQSITNASIAKRLNLAPAVIPVVSLPVALANKMAAWLERRLIRDLYDIYFYLNMGVKPDTATLEKRLSKPRYVRNVKAFPDTSPMAVKNFYSFLRETVDQIPEEEISKSLADLFPPGDLTGIPLRMKAVISNKLY